MSKSTSLALTLLALAAIVALLGAAQTAVPAGQDVSTGTRH